MFNRKLKQRVNELEQKVKEMANILKIKWTIVQRYDSYSPPTMFYQQYSANQLDVLEKLLEYLNLEVVEEPNKYREIKIVKKKINKLKK